jgi:hypothetical protein
VQRSSCIILYSEKAGLENPDYLHIRRNMAEEKWKEHRARLAELKKTAGMMLL